MEEVEGHFESGGGGEILAAVGEAGFAAGEFDEGDRDVGAVSAVGFDGLGEFGCV